MPDPFLCRRYDDIWSGAIDRVRSGAVEIDAVLARGGPDRRRALTLLARPAPGVQRRVGEAIAALRQLEPGQYYYHPAELHVTFLSLFTATEEHASRFDRMDDFDAAVSATMSRLAPFQLHFSGVTTSPAAVIVQGFTDSTVLNAARDDLRGELRARGLTAGLDERYRLESAHMTMVRFREPLRDGAAFAQALENLRAVDFGETRAGELQLVRNDWYMSRAGTELLRTYALTPPSGTSDF